MVHDGRKALNTNAVSVRIVVLGIKVQLIRKVMLGLAVNNMEEHYDYGADLWKQFVDEQIEFSELIEFLRDYANDNMIG